ncbi:MAG: alpha/beta hydrolase [Oscillospiraceae bacterium]|nr:alpha/beta hydrolase [Oscillospiraceae bacterium]
MRKLKRFLAFATALTLLLLMVPAAYAFSSEESEQTALEEDVLNILNHEEEWVLVENEEIGDYYALEGIVYVANPVDEEYESLNIYVPAAYFEGGSINGYTAETAPIMFVVNVGGYAGSIAATLGNGSGVEPASLSASSDEASGETDVSTPGLSEVSDDDVGSYSVQMGYVVVTVGCRGRDTTNEDGSYNGKGFAGLVDLKAAIRYLRYNSENLCGDTEKIIAVGHSAGGALVTLLGTTGNSEDYESYLQELGAADERDDIYAAAPSCPITDMDNGDLAYEWMFGSLVDETDTLSVIISEGLAAMYPAYINSLGLIDAETGEALTLEEDGTGSFQDYVLAILSESATEYLKELDEETLDAYLAENEDWLSWDSETQTATVYDMDGYAAHAGRMSGVPPFDAIDLSATANWTYGDTDGEYVHFTTYVYDILMAAGYTEEAEAYSTAEVSELVAEQVRLLNPMNYILDGTADTATYFRIVVGSMDTFQPASTSIALAAALETYTVTQRSSIT